MDYEQLHRIHQAGRFFVILIRAKSHLRFQLQYSLESDRATGIICNQIGKLAGSSSAQDYPAPLRRIRIKDDEGKTLVFLASNTELPARTDADLYRCRWQIELFFKWIKHHLRIKSFFGTSENAVRTQIQIAVYVLVAILKKRLQLSASLYEILQMLGLTAFERNPLDQLLVRIPSSDQPEKSQPVDSVQLTLGRY